jgi:hypothetical protein
MDSRVFDSVNVFDYVNDFKVLSNNFAGDLAKRLDATEGRIGGDEFGWK